MTRELSKNHKGLHNYLLLFFSMLLFKIACDLGYCKLLILDTATYKYDVNLIKYVNSMFWCIILFLGIRHDKRKVSTFMLYLVYLTQIIPISTIYAFSNGSAEYYNILCISFAFCELYISLMKRDSVDIKRNPIVSFAMTVIFYLVTIFLLVYIYRANGAPSLIALDIYDVYELRSSGLFYVSKYMSYVLRWVVASILPFLIAQKICDKKYFTVALLIVIIFIVYLYSGQKSYLFSIPLICICSLWARRKNFYYEIFTVGSISFFILVLLACYSMFYRDFFIKVYSLLGRRILMVSANNKFAYYDFFSNNPKMGFGGIIPRWLINIPNYYENIDYTHIISKIYYGKPEMSSNTGFLAEGFMRFGHLGTVFILFLFSMILKLMDKLQNKAGYTLVVGAFVYSVLALTDTYLLESLIFGTWMIPLIILLVYIPVKNKTYSKFLKRSKLVWRRK